MNIDNDLIVRYKLDKIDALVSATCFEQHSLWVQNDERPHPRFGGIKRPWHQETMGFGLTIGHVDDRPIVMSFSFATVSDKRICFWELTSQLADYKMADEWLAKTFPNVFRRTNAMNFHHVFEGC